MDELTTVHGRLIMIDPKVAAPPAVLPAVITSTACVHTTLCLPCPARLLSSPCRRPALPIPQDDTTGFAQLTVRVPSTQRFAAYDRRGKLVAGSPEQVRAQWAGLHVLGCTKPSHSLPWCLLCSGVQWCAVVCHAPIPQHPALPFFPPLPSRQAIEVEDFWVFEHSLKAAAANRWRVAGRLSIQPDPTVAAAIVGTAAGVPQQQSQQQQPAGIRLGHIAEQQQEKQQQPAKEPGRQTGGERRAAKLAAKHAAAAAAGRGKR